MAGANDEPTQGQRTCGRCASPAKADATTCANCTADLTNGHTGDVPANAAALVAAGDLRWASILTDLMNGDVRIGVRNPEGVAEIQLSTPTGVVTLKSLALLILDLQALVAGKVIVDDLAGDQRRAALFTVADRLQVSPGCVQIINGFLVTDQGHVSLDLVGKLLKRGVQA